MHWDSVTAKRPMELICSVSLIAKRSGFSRRWIVEFGTITALSRNHRTRANAAIDPGRQMSVGINGLPEWLTIKERLVNAQIFVASKR